MPDRRAAGAHRPPRAGAPHHYGAGAFSAERELPGRRRPTAEEPVPEGAAGAGAGAADDEVAVADAARRGNQQLDRDARLAVNALRDVAMADRYAVGINGDPGRHGQHDVSVAERDRQVEGRLADDGGGEIDEDVAVPGLHRQAA